MSQTPSTTSSNAEVHAVPTMTTGTTVVAEAEQELPQAAVPVRRQRRRKVMAAAGMFGVLAMAIITGSAGVVMLVEKVVHASPSTSP